MNFRGLDEYYAWLAKLPLLAKAGISSMEDYHVVTSWEVANQACDADESVNYFIGFGNRVRDALREVDPTAVTRRWNEQGQQLLFYAAAFRDNCVTPRYPHIARYPDLLQRIVNHTVIAGQELMFRDLVDRDDAFSLVAFFQTGHAIVGYKGEYPDGSRIIF
jgi:hypothetical protein